MFVSFIWVQASIVLTRTETHALINLVFELSLSITARCHFLLAVTFCTLILFVWSTVCLFACLSSSPVPWLLLYHSRLLVCLIFSVRMLCFLAVLLSVCACDDDTSSAYRLQYFLSFFLMQNMLDCFRCPFNIIVVVACSFTSWDVIVCLPDNLSFQHPVSLPVRRRIGIVLFLRMICLIIVLTLRRLQTFGFSFDVWFP